MKLNICWFLPLPAGLIAKARRLYAARGLDVVARKINSSNEQYGLLESGEADVAVTAMDNVFGWNMRGGIDDLRVMAQVERSTKSVLMGAPGVATLEDIRGGQLIVDAPDNGFVVVTRAMLRDAGLAPHDYQLVVVGGVQARVEALCRGEGDAALLVPLFEERVLEAGGHVLGRVDDYYPDFPGQGLVARSSRWNTLAPAMSAWLDALREAGDWTRANTEEALEIVAGETGLPKHAASGILEAIPSSFCPTSRSLECVVEQRRGLGMPGAHAGIPSLFDPRPTPLSRLDFRLSAPNTPCRLNNKF